MNILMLTSVYPQPDDNLYKTTKTVKYYCDEWSKQGHKVIVIHNNSVFPKVFYYIPSFIKRIIEYKHGIQIPDVNSCKNLRRIENGVLIFREKMIKLIPHSAFSKKEIEKQGEKIISVLEKEEFVPDLIAAHWGNPQIALLGWLKNHYKRKFVSSIVFHNDCEKKNIEKYNLIELIKSVDVVGCRSRIYGNKVKKRLNLSYDPFVCYSGFPDIIAEKINIKKVIESKKKNTILYVGRLMKYKKVDTIIKAVSKCDNKDKVKLEIIGEGVCKVEILDLCKRNNIEKQVKFIDKLSREEIFEYMKKSECLTMVSENETFGMVYIEAMLMGCITIASKNSALDGVIKDGINGFLCEAGNFEELMIIYNKIKDMNKEEKEKIMFNAHKTALKFKDSELAKNYLDDIFSIYRINKGN